MNPEIRKVLQRLSTLVTWTQSPGENPNQIHTILSNLTDNELLCAFTMFQGPPARLAWAEYGRRKGFIDFKVEATQLGDGQVSVLFEGEGKPIHEGPLFDLEEEPEA